MELEQEIFLIDYPDYRILFCPLFFYSIQRYLYYLDHIYCFFLLMNIIEGGSCLSI